MDEGLHKVARVGDIAPGTARQVVVDEMPIALVNLNGAVCAIYDVCSHEEAFLSEGEVLEDEETIMCPLHGSEFSLKTGRALTLPATQPIPTYEVRTEGDDIYVKI